MVNLRKQKLQKIFIKYGLPLRPLAISEIMALFYNEEKKEDLFTRKARTRND